MTATQHRTVPTVLQSDSVDAVGMVKMNGPTPTELAALKVAELKRELKRLGLPTSGKKAELAGRLEQYWNTSRAAEESETKVEHVATPHAAAAVATLGTRRQADVGTVVGVHAPTAPEAELKSASEAAVGRHADEEAAPTAPTAAPAVSALAPVLGGPQPPSATSS